MRLRGRLCAGPTAPGLHGLATALAAMTFGLLGGCVPASVAAPAPGDERMVDWAPPSRAELEEARDWLDRLRAALGDRTEEIGITLEAPLLPGAIRARGAIAVAPGRAARLVMIGPGGTTAADLWMDRERHRLAIPVRDEIVRGKRGEPLRGIPIELFRTWFLEPLAGELLDASIDGDVLHAVLRTPEATVFVRALRQGELRLERVPRTVEEGPRDVEVIVARRGTECARVTYERPRVGVRAEIVCSARRASIVEKALLDPDRGPP